MKIKEITYKISCDIPGCENLAKYALLNTQTGAGDGLNMCADCTRELYEHLGKNLVPKSPKNILNNNLKRGK